MEQFLLVKLAYILKGEPMQVNYKTISSLEFDVLSGTYKKVEKQVEDDSAFSSLLDTASGGGDEPFSLKASGAEASANDLLKGFSSVKSDFSSDFQTSLYNYRFRQNEESLLQAKEQGSSANEKNNANLMNDLLSAL